MSKPIDINDEQFEAEVLKSSTPVIVDFWAEWCGPCRMIAPHLKEIATEYDGKVKVVKVDVDENPMIAGRYGVMSIPTLLLIKDGEVVNRITGALPKDQIVAKMTPHFAA